MNNLDEFKKMAGNYLDDVVGEVYTRDVYRRN